MGGKVKEKSRSVGKEDGKGRVEAGGGSSAWAVPMDTTRLSGGQTVLEGEWFMQRLAKEVSVAGEEGVRGGGGRRGQRGTSGVQSIRTSEMT